MKNSIYPSGNTAALMALSSARVQALARLQSRITTDMAAAFAAPSAETLRLTADMAAKFAAQSAETFRLTADMAARFAATNAKISRLTADISRRADTLIANCGLTMPSAARQ